jgi:transcription elongation factor Elf1
LLCPDCNEEIDVPIDIQEREVVKCSCCGLEFEYHNGELYEIELEGVDFGE